MARKRSENNAVVSNGGASAKLLIANTTSASRKKHSVSRANAKSAITERENPAPEVAAAEGPSREEIARLWYAEEFRPVVRMLREADLIGSGTDAEAYQRVARERYRLMRTHEWNDEVIERLRREIR